MFTLFQKPKYCDLALILGACSAWYLNLGQKMFFIYDEWEWWRGLVDRPIGSDLFTPYKDSLNAGLFLIWHFLTPIAGMTYLWYQFVTLFFHLIGIVSIWSICNSIGFSRTKASAVAILYATITPAVGNVIFGWQMAWTAGLSLGLLAIFIELNFTSIKSSLLACSFVALGILIGPAALPFLISLMTICLLKRFYPAILMNALVLALWFYWRFQMADPESVINNLRIPFEAEGLRYIGSGLTHTLNNMWPLVIFLFAVVLTWSCKKGFPLNKSFYNQRKINPKNHRNDLSTSIGLFCLH